MDEKTGRFEGLDGCRLYYKAWLPDGPPKAVLAIVHGVGEHIERYRNVVDCLVPGGYVLMGYDQRGHGRSEGQRGHINSWDEYRQDIRIFLDLARKIVPGIPLFLYGHSQGSLEVLDYILRYPAGLAGAIISGTALEPKDAAPPLLVILAKIMSGIFPRFTLRVKLEGDSLSRDPLVARAYMEDPLVHWERSARWGTESLKTIQWIKSHASEIRLPVLFLHGGADSLVSVTGAEEIYEKIQYPDKTLRVYPQDLHEPHHDLDCLQVISDLGSWMEAHI